MLRGGDQVMCMFYMMCNTGGGTLVVVVGGDRCQNRENIVSTMIIVKFLAGNQLYELKCHRIG